MRLKIRPAFARTAARDDQDRDAGHGDCEERDDDGVQWGEQNDCQTHAETERGEAVGDVWSRRSLTTRPRWHA